MVNQFEFIQTFLNDRTCVLVPCGYEYHKVDGFKQQNIIPSQFLEAIRLQWFSGRQTQGADMTVLSLET